MEQLCSHWVYFHEILFIFRKYIKKMSAHWNPTRIMVGVYEDLYIYIYIYIYRVIHDLWTLLQEVFVIKKVNIKFVRFWTVTELWAFFNSRTRPRVNRVSRNQLAGDVISLVAYLLRCQRYFRQLTRAVHNRTAACVAAGGGIFENQL